MGRFTVTIAFVLFVSLAFPSEVVSQRHQVSLDEYGDYVLGWVVDSAAQTITFDVAVLTTGYVGLGISPTGAMDDSDIAIGVVFDDGTRVVKDYMVKGNYQPAEDAQQDYHILHGYETDSYTYMRFWRRLDTGDVDDIPITNSTQNIIWAIGGSDDLDYHFRNRGIYAVNLLNPSI